MSILHTIQQTVDLHATLVPSIDCEIRSIEVKIDYNNCIVSSITIVHCAVRFASWLVRVMNFLLNRLIAILLKLNTNSDTIQRLDE